VALVRPGFYTLGDQGTRASIPPRNANLRALFPTAPLRKGAGRANGLVCIPPLEGRRTTCDRSRRGKILERERMRPAPPKISGMFGIAPSPFPLWLERGQRELSRGSSHFP
jgi:hypothetical protein